MSNLGQVALIVVGTVVGAYVGYPQLGFVLGSLAGSALFPTQLPSGPRITDGRTTTATIGGPVPIVFGTADVAGTVMWLAPYVQTSNHSGSKGGPQQTTYQYNQSIAIGLCEGPIGTVLRIWENGAIVYDIRPQQAANADLNQRAETDLAYHNRLTVSGRYAGTFTLHTGTEDQLADPTIEAVLGFGNVPGFRGLAYIVYPNRLLQTAQGWRHPNFRFEVSTACANATTCVASLLLHFDSSFLDSSTFAHSMSQLGDAAVSGGALIIPDTSTSTGGSIYTPIVAGDSLDVLSGSDDFTIECTFKVALANGTNFIICDYGNDRVTYGGTHGVIIEASCSGVGVGTLLANPTIPAWSAIGSGSHPISQGVNYHVALVRIAGVTTLYFQGNAVGTATNWNSYSCPSPSYVTLGWTPTISGGLNPGEIDEFRVVKGCGIYTANFTPPTVPLASAISLGNCLGATIASIISAVCARAGLTQVDAADMATTSILGYAVSTITSASAILSPLRSVGFFDAIESQGQMKFKARGKAVVATLTVDDLGAFEEVGNSVPPPSVTVVRAQDEDLPARIRFKYKAVARDYQDSEQDSPFRLATKAVNQVDIAVPLCMADLQAAQCAEVIWADSWAARTTYQIALDQSWLALDCGDAIAVPIDGVIERLRIVSDTTAGGVLRKLSCVKDDSGAYISFAVPNVPQVQPQVLSFVGPTTYELLDLPALSDADNDPGFYVAAQRQSGGGQWGGCLLYQSLDGGATYAQLFAVTTEATMGTINAPVGASEAYVWDNATTIVVNVANASVTFESRTDDAVIAGANAAAMGADGRWEIVQFATATQVSPTQWNLTRLLRGRRGTEHVMGSSVTGDAFVMVSTGDLVRQVLEQSQIGTSLKYKVVSLGLAYSSGIDQTFAGHGQALVPFSPIDLAGAIVSGDIHLTWVRRGRLGRTLMSGVDIPLSEATEAYQVDILSGTSPETVKRTIAVTTQAAIYTAADQTTDFGAPVTTTLTIAVYQMSAIVGRGTPAIATLTL